MARKVTARRVWVSTAAAWLFGFLIFLPILWMVLTSFKTELEAFSMPPKFLLFHWTMENYATVQERSDYLHHALNSIVIAGGSTLIAMIIAIPAAWSMAFAPTKRTKDVLLWMLSTKMMPSVGVLVPIYLIFRDFGLLDTRAGLVMILCLGNLPIVRRLVPVGRAWDGGSRAVVTRNGDRARHELPRASGDEPPRVRRLIERPTTAGTALVSPKGPIDH